MDKLIYAIKNANREDFIMATASGLTALFMLVDIPVWAVFIGWTWYLSIGANVRAIKEGAIIAYGGTEREFLKKHRKRYWAVTTYAFRAMNRSVGVLFHPYRQYKIQKMDIPD